MKIGVARLHGLVSAVLPQLQHNPGRGFALAAVETVLFDRCSAVLSALLGGPPTALLVDCEGCLEHVLRNEKLMASGDGEQRLNSVLQRFADPNQ